MAAIEQGAADEAFERLDAAAERGRRQREFLRRRLDRTETGDLDERLDSGQRRQAPHGGNPRSSGGNATIDDQPRRHNDLHFNFFNSDSSFRTCTKLHYTSTKTAFTARL